METEGGDLALPTSQIPLNDSLLTQLGDNAHEFAAALVELAGVHWDDGLDELMEVIIQTERRFGVEPTPIVVNRMAETICEAHGHVSVVNGQTVLAGSAPSGGEDFAHPSDPEAPDRPWGT